MIDHPHLNAKTRFETSSIWRRTRCRWLVFPHYKITGNKTNILSQIYLKPMFCIRVVRDL